MYIRKFIVSNLRSISSVEMDFKSGEEAGWHVILGANGTGKTSLIRAVSLVLMGEREAYASRQDFTSWLRNKQDKAQIDIQLVPHREFDDKTTKGPWRSGVIKLTAAMERDETRSNFVDLKFRNEGGQKTIWGGGDGWFSASFGPYRRFTGGDSKYERLFVTNKRLAPHLTALGEDVALTDALQWLNTLFNKMLQERNASNTDAPGVAEDLFHKVWKFINQSQFFPNKEEIYLVSSEHLSIKDANGFLIQLDQLSDGYRSALSLVLELLRQMVELYGEKKICSVIEGGVISAPGVVLIDEVDVHLHPTWQRDLGVWLTKCFPMVQFIVTTHSPIVCRALSAKDGTIKGSIWKLPSFGSGDNFRRLDGVEETQLVYGDVLDAYSTELFGSDVIRSDAGKVMLDRLAELNLKALEGPLSREELQERKKLRQAFPTEPGLLRRVNA